MKKFFVIIALLILIYFATVGILKAAKICPEYLNLMPGPEKPNIPAWQALFCPFTEKVY